MSSQVTTDSLTAYKGGYVKNPTNEDVYRTVFHEAREFFAQRHLNLHLSKVTHQDILSKMYEVQGNPQYITKYRKEIWKDFQSYMGARQTYLSLIPNVDFTELKTKIRAIDPTLLEEERYHEDLSPIHQTALDIYFGTRRLMTSSATLIRKQGRMEVLKETFQREEMDQKVINLFKKHINASEGLETAREIDAFLIRIDNRSEYASLREGKEKFLDSLKDGGLKNDDLTFNRLLVAPE